jgi:hypothetical protein
MRKFSLRLIKMDQEFSIQNKNIIHIKFEYSEAIKSRRYLLESERNILQIARSVHNYKFLRSQELKFNIRLYKKFKEINSKLKKIQTSVPKIKIPEEITPKKIISQVSQIEPEYDNSLEEELLKIQKKLNKLKQQNL